jgi:hypothetical protein
MELVSCFGTFALLGGAIPNQNSIGDMISHASRRPKAGRRASGFVQVAKCLQIRVALVFGSLSNDGPHVHNRLVIDGSPTNTEAIAK